MKLRQRLFFGFFCLSIAMTPLYADLKVGTEFFFPPYVLTTSQGFEINLMQMICQRLHERCQFEPMNFKNLFPALDSGRVDLAIGGINIIPSRLQKYIFSFPYKMSEGQFLISSNTNMKSIEELQNHKVGVIKGEEDGGVAYRYLLEHFKNQFIIKQYNDTEDLVSALSKNEISAAFLNHSSAVYWTRNSGGQFKTLGEKRRFGEGIGIMALPAKANLIQRINQILKAMEKDNSYLNLYKMYFANE